VLTPARVAALLAARAANSTDAALFFAQLEQHAEWALTQPPVAHGVPGPSGILMNVRFSLDLLLTSAAAHALIAVPGNASDLRFLRRAELEALNLCVSWPDWNTVQHALDTGEALLATGLAYDWLAPYSNASVLSAISAGIVSRGLEPYRAFMHNSSVFWWRNNSISMCRGAIRRDHSRHRSGCSASATDSRPLTGATRNSHPLTLTPNRLELRLQLGRRRCRACSLRRRRRTELGLGRGAAAARERLGRRPLRRGL